MLRGAPELDVTVGRGQLMRIEDSVAFSTEMSPGQERNCAAATGIARQNYQLIKVSTFCIARNVHEFSFFFEWNIELGTI